MTKVVYNACYGGFGLSEKAILRYAELKGLDVWIEGEKYFKTYWTCPPEERKDLLEGTDWHTATQEQRQKSSDLWNKHVLYDRDFDRTDPILVQVVEELGSELASGMCAELQIEDIPKGTAYRIDEYDGDESVMFQSSYDWSIA